MLASITAHSLVVYGHYVIMNNVHIQCTRSFSYNTTACIIKIHSIRLLLATRQTVRNSSKQKVPFNMILGFSHISYTIQHPDFRHAAAKCQVTIINHTHQHMECEPFGFETTSFAVVWRICSLGGRRSCGNDSLLAWEAKWTE